MSTERSESLSERKRGKVNSIVRPYIPQVGDSVGARRKVKSNIYANTIVGPVVDTWPNACRIVTNLGTDIKGDFRLYYSDWYFQFLHKTNVQISGGTPSAESDCWQSGGDK